MSAADINKIVNMLARVPERAAELVVYRALVVARALREKRRAKRGRAKRQF